MKPAIVVTGAASGIGRALALQAAREGAPMVLIDVAQQNLDQAAAEIASANVETHALVLDLADRAAGQAIEEALARRGLHCDVLINSAGLFLYGPAAELDAADQLRLLDVNARAVAELSLRFLPGMLQRGRGGILNVSSITAYTAGPYMGVYFATKAFVKSFTAALAAEVGTTMRTGFVGNVV
jgi:short-subunit dehydrogenase